MGLVGASPPRAHPVALPPADNSRGSTSIDFGENQLSPGLIGLSPYPQVIRAVFNPHRFGPPLGVTRASPCSWVDRPGFGSTPGYSLALASGLAFAPAPRDTRLASHPSSNSPDHNAKGTQSGPTRVAPCAPSYRLWACGFRLSFTPRPGVLFTCPSRYSSAIGHTGVFSLGGWSPQLHARLLVPGVTQELH